MAALFILLHRALSSYYILLSRTMYLSDRLLHTYLLYIQFLLDVVSALPPYHPSAALIAAARTGASAACVAALG